MILTERLQVSPGFFREVSARAAESPGEVVMAVRRPGSRVLLSTKSFYPEGVYRLPTGKLSKDETPEQGFLREIREETGFTPKERSYLGRIDCAFVCGGESVLFASHVFATEEMAGAPEPEDKGEQLAGFLDVEIARLPEVSARLGARFCARRTGILSNKLILWHAFEGYSLDSKEYIKVSDCSPSIRAAICLTTDRIGYNKAIWLVKRGAAEVCLARI